MHPGDGDGYDVYRVANGWVTGGDTRDGGGYSQSEFGADCKPFGGWVLFRRASCANCGLEPREERSRRFAGSYWEQAGLPWPGRCERGKELSTSTLTTWSFSPGHEFGGLEEASQTDRRDRLALTAGRCGPIRRLWAFPAEQFYFTDLYGATRWEGWISNPEKPPKAATNCSGPTEMTYEGNVYTRVACRDWSFAEINNPPRPRRLALSRGQYPCGLALYG